MDEFLHVWENHLTLRDVVRWLQDQGMEMLRMTDYYDQEISLDIARPYRLSAFARRGTR